MLTDRKKISRNFILRDENSSFTALKHLLINLVAPSPYGSYKLRAGNTLLKLTA